MLLQFFACFLDIIVMQSYFVHSISQISIYPIPILEIKGIMQQAQSSKSLSFASDVFKLVTGTTIAQIITVLATLIITRLYGPEAFGLLAIFISITGIIGAIACMRYEFAIMLPKTNEEAANIFGLCILCTTTVSGLTALSLYFIGDTLLFLLKAPGLSPYLILIPIFVFITGISLALNYWNSRTRNFGRLSIARITRSIAIACTQLGAGVAGYATSASLIGANIIGLTVSIGILGSQILRDDHAILHKNISWRGMLSGMKRYKKFPLIDSCSVLLNAISWQLPTFFLAMFFSPVVVGLYTLGFQALQLPMSLIGDSIAQVFFQRASTARSDGSLPIIVENLFRILITIGIFPIFVIAIIGPDIFAIIFGKLWEDAGLYAQILSIWSFMFFISSPISTLWIVLEKQEFGMRVNILNFITRIISLAIGGLVGDPKIALLLFAVSGVFVYGYLNLKLMMFAGVKMVNIKKYVLSSLKLFCPFGAILAGFKIISVEPLFLVVIACILCIIYYLYILHSDRQINSLVKGILAKGMNKYV